MGHHGQPPRRTETRGDNADPRAGSAGPVPWADLLRRTAARLQMQRALLGALTTLGPALALVLLLLLAARLWPLPHWRLWAGLPLLLWTGFHLIRLPSLRPTPMQTARTLDRQLALQERLSTALELYQRDLHSPLIQAQQADARVHARAVDPARDLPWRLPRRALALAGLLLSLVLLLLFLPNPQDAVLQQRAAVRQAAAEQAAELEELADEIAALEGFPPKEQEALVRQLREAAERLRANRGDPAEAVADLERARQALRRQAEEWAAQREAVDQVEQALRDLAAELSQGNPEAQAALQNALETLPEQLAKMNEQEIAELAARMEELARRAAADPELAHALEDLAQAVSESDPQAVQQTVEALAQALERSQESIARRAQAEATLEEALASLEEGLAETPPPGNGEGAGDTAPGQGAGGAAEGGSGEGGGEGSTGAGGEGSGESSTGAGGGWHQDPNRPNEATGPAQEEVYVPLGPDGRPAYIPGQPSDTTGETWTTLPAPDPGEEGVALPYDTVYRAYREAAARSLERTYIPPALQEYVRDYFSRLEPPGEP